MKKYSGSNNFLLRRLINNSQIERNDVEIGACIEKNEAIGYTKNYDRQKLENKLNPYETFSSIRARAYNHPETYPQETDFYGSF